MADEILTDGEGQLRAMLTVGGNPVLSCPDSERFDAALASLEFMLAIDCYVNETTRHADVILPAPSHLEKPHYDVALLGLAIRNVANYSSPVLELPDGAEATVRTLWDGDTLYVLAEVADPTLDVTGSDPWIQDSVEIFVDAGNTRAGTYGPDDSPIRINVDNVVSFGTGDGASQSARLTSATARVDGGYVVEAAIVLAASTSHARGGVGARPLPQRAIRSGAEDSFARGASATSRRTTASNGPRKSWREKSRAAIRWPRRTRAAPSAPPKTYRIPRRCQSGGTSGDKRPR